MATFRANRAGLRQYLKSTDVYPPLERVAGDIEARAKANAPVESAASAASHRRRAGTFRDSIHTARHIGPNRNTVQVIADADYATLVERRSRPLGRAAY